MGRHPLLPLALERPPSPRCL